jgi:PAS domain S-box-containing protein
MQNETLRQSQRALEESRDRYLNLYEFAPVSFITLSQTGQITEINLTGAALLGEDRKKLLQRRFNKYVAQEEHGRWQRYFLNALKHGEKQCCELKGCKKDGSIFYVYLESRLITSVSAMPTLHLTLSDITEKKRSEEERHQFEMRLHKLTNREREVLELALTGAINRDISTQLKISQRTVENHRSRIHFKTGVISLLELAQQAVRAGVSVAEIVKPSKAHNQDNMGNWKFSK